MPDSSDGTPGTPTKATAIPSSAPKPTRWADGNFTISSSDNRIFKVADYHLLSSSSVFRAMMSAARGVLRIELSDPAIEDWITVDRALDFIVNGQFDDARIKHTVSVCLFFKKYNCAASMKQFIFCIKHAPFAPRVKTFIVGACLDDEDMCLMALKYPLPSWEKHEGASEVGREGNSVPLAGCQFNTGSWAMCWASATPTQYKWALDRAWFRAGNTAANFPNFASEFKTLLTRAKATEL